MATGDRYDRKLLSTLQPALSPRHQTFHGRRLYSETLLGCGCEMG